MSQTVLVCDDDESLAKRWARDLKRRAELPTEYKVEALTFQEFESAVEEVTLRRANVRQGKRAADEGTALFDSAAVLVIDYDLFALDKGSLLTGEAVAYLARCYSSCGVIIGLNQFGENPFDLRLQGHPKSFADINIGGAQLANPGLWKMPSRLFREWEAFRPWHWPSVPQLVRDFETRVDEVATDLDRSVYSFLGFDDDLLALFPTASTDFLVGRSPVTQPTFRSVASESGLGLKGNDEGWNDRALARITASRVSAWLEQVVLPNQDILVDGPHLVTRFPSLNSRGISVDALNRTTNLDIRANAGLDAERIGEARFVPAHWLSRPAWIWPRCARLQTIREVADPFGSHPPVVEVFCEDVSAFLDPLSAREFNAELQSSYSRRFVVDPESANQYAKAIKSVDYSPQSRLVRS